MRELNERRNKDLSNDICKLCNKSYYGTAVYEIGNSIYIQCIVTGTMWCKEDANAYNN